MKKLKHETELVKGAILAGMKYGVERGAVVFEPTDSASEKIRLGAKSGTDLFSVFSGCLYLERIPL